MNTVNRIKNPWIRPWNTKQFNDLYNRDERFLSILLKGTISFLNSHIKMYNKPINHFVFNTGSSYMYVESNGYEFNWNETTGEDTMYMELPRCVIQMSNIDVPQEELSQPFARGNYERKDDDKIKGFNAEIQRIPIELSLDLHYVFSNFNEGIVVMQELIDELIFQRYFNIAYLGQIVQCSIEFSNSYNIELNHIDLGAAEQNVRNLNIQVKICTNYPVINIKTEIPTSQVIAKFSGFIEQSGRRKNIRIFIDGVESKQNDIYIDLRKYDLNNDGIVNDDELTLIQEFIQKFDIDGDEEVTSKDINVITEEFMNNQYNLNYDILNKGKLDHDNLVVIKQLFTALDVNYDNIVNQYEVDEIVQMIMLFKNFDFNHDLCIDYNDVNSIIKFIYEHENQSYQDLLNIIINLMDEKDDFDEKIFSQDFKDYILNIIETDLENFKMAIEYYIRENNISIQNSILQQLYKHLSDLLNFKIYDLNNDDILNENDINVLINNINNFTEYKISYYVSSDITIHMNDHTLNNSSISDVENIKM